MKNSRILIALTVLCGLILLTGYSVWKVRQSCGILIQQSEQVMEAIHTGADAEPEIEALEQLWRKKSRLLHLFLPNQTLTDLNEAILRLHALCTSESDELTAELSSVIADLEWIRAGQYPAVL